MVRNGRRGHACLHAPNHSGCTARILRAAHSGPHHDTTRPCAEGRMTARVLSSGAMSLREWLANPELNKAPQVVIPRIAVAGRVTLLSGREKIGKSSLAGGVVSAASRGESVLGEP